ncbi:MAG: type II toxin-antitoxin system HipA family toxin [Saprospiraceae bacterium]
MAKALDVYIHNELVGKLIQNDGGQMEFSYAPSWLGREPTYALSHSLPVQEEPFKQKECRGFFGGILPEEANRTTIAKILGISDRNDFAMLEHIGGECAGAITFLPEDTPLPDANESYRDINDDELYTILEELPRRPLMAGTEEVRLSLAGAQDKIAVRYEDGKISIPLGGAPSTHILKPVIKDYDGLVFNEAFCMALAKASGLSAANTIIAKTSDKDYLLIERYDRTIDDGGAVQRLAQEDFCQALGIPSETKYQSEGGPTLKDCFALLRVASKFPVLDLNALLDAVIFNFVIGNHDAHAKNFSLLTQPDGLTRLAPLYDLASTVYYPELTENMAMKLGGEARSTFILPVHIETFAGDAGLGKALVRNRVPELTQKIHDSIDSTEQPHEVATQVAELIKKRCVNVLSNFS